MRTLLLTLTTCLFALPVQAKYSGGSGTAQDPYQIATAADLIALGETPADYNKHFVMTADIDLDPRLPGRKVFDRAVIAPAEHYARGGEEWIDGSFFVGVFDGNGHAISHLTIAGKSFLGLFGYLASGAGVKDLGVDDVAITGAGDSVGGLVGCCDSGTVIRCHSTGSVSGDNVGGLVGDNWGTVTQCYSIAIVSGRWCVGGLVGTSGGHVTQCYSTGGVTGTDNVGGLMGENYSGTMTCCYSTAAVSGKLSVGGLVGSGWEQRVAASFWDIQASGQTTSAGGVGKTTAEMQMASTFLFWNAWGPFWTIDEGRNYPHLAWETGPGRLITDLTYVGGTGTSNDPYLIHTAQQLNSMGLAPCREGNFKLIADIDLSGFDGKEGRPAFEAIGTSPREAFSGVFDGNGHTISHLTIKGGYRAGLFGELTSLAEVKNLGVVDVNIIGSGDGGCVGAIAGVSYSGSVTHCYSTGVINGRDHAGGLVGWNKGTVTQCHSTAAVSGTGWCVGGIVGESDGVVTACHSTGAITGHSWVGGLVGWNQGVVAQCYSSSAVIGNDCVGGLAAVNAADRGRMTHCYSTGMVRGKENVGGLVGSAYKRDVVACFWDIETSGQTKSAGGTAKTTAEMQTAKTFLGAGWDFVGETTNGTADIWWILEGKDYPRLWWEPAKK